MAGVRCRSREGGGARDSGPGEWQTAWCREGAANGDGCGTGKDRAGGCERADAYCRQDSEEGRDREKPTGLYSRMKRREFLRLVPIAAVGISAASCGYALAGRGSFLPAYIKTLGIPLFENATPYQTIEQLFTNKVRLEFQSSRRYT